MLKGREPQARQVLASLRNLSQDDEVIELEFLEMKGENFFIPCKRLSGDLLPLHELYWCPSWCFSDLPKLMEVRQEHRAN